MERSKPAVLILPGVRLCRLDQPQHIPTVSSDSTPPRAAAGPRDTAAVREMRTAGSRQIASGMKAVARIGGLMASPLEVLAATVTAVWISTFRSIFFERGNRADGWCVGR